MTAIQLESLYQRLGGYEVIAGLVDELYQRLLNGPQTWYHWKGRSADIRASEQRLYIDFVCSFAGRHVGSLGSDNETPSRGLGIGKVEWGHFVESAAEALEASGLGDLEKEELFCLICRFKAVATEAKQTPSSIGVFAAYPNELTQRETEVLRHVAMGKNNSEIAEELFISVNTVTRHLTNIFGKTSTRNRVEAAVYAARRRIV